MSRTTTKKVIAGTIIGLVAGYVVGILTAPKSGKETRQQIKATSTKAWHEAEIKLKELYGELTEQLDEAATKARQATAKGRQEIEHLINEARDARHKVKIMLSAIHDGEADDPDLEIAIKQASEAKRHLVSYFKKS